MGEPKPLASLSSTLLARKGHAKPAMRPQGFGGFGGGFGGGHDDLGWNDMGHDPRQPVLQAVEPAAAQVPAVVRQREELAEELNGKGVIDALAEEQIEEIEAEAEIELPVEPRVIVAHPIPPVAVERARKAAKGRKSKAAFTLRVDPDRHLKLRLACAITRESAQAIVTEALDKYLGSFPEIDELALKVPGKKH